MTAVTLADRVMDATVDTLAYLKGRWADEKQFEDFAEYAKAMAKVVDAVEGVKFVRMTKSPFGFEWDGGDGFRRHTRFKGRNNVVTVRIGMPSSF